MRLLKKENQNTNEHIPYNFIDKKKKFKNIKYFSLLTNQKIKNAKKNRSEKKIFLNAYFLIKKNKQKFIKYNKIIKTENLLYYSKIKFFKISWIFIIKLFKIVNILHRDFYKKQFRTLSKIKKIRNFILVRSKLKHRILKNLMKNKKERNLLRVNSHINYFAKVRKFFVKKQICKILNIFFLNFKITYNLKNQILFYNLDLKNLARKFKKFIVMKKKSIMDLNEKIDRICLNLIQYDKKLDNSKTMYLDKKSKKFFRVQKKLCNFLFDYKNALSIYPLLKKNSREKIIYFKKEILLNSIKKKYPFIYKNFKNSKIVSQKFLNYEKLMKSNNSFFGNFDLKKKKKTIFQTEIMNNKNFLSLFKNSTKKLNFRHIDNNLFDNCKEGFTVNVTRDFLSRIIFEIMINN